MSHVYMRRGKIIAGGDGGLGVEMCENGKRDQIC